MRKRVAILTLLASLLVAGNARAAELPGLLPQLLPPRLLTEVGKPVPPAPPFRSGFTVSADHHYEVRVFTFGSAVLLEVLRTSQHGLSASVYLARGVATPHRLQATFGKFGKISMRFQPPARGDGVKSVCRFGERLSQHRGLYMGRLNFKGEDGYVSLDLHRAKGAIVTPAGRCRRHHFTSAQIERALEFIFEPLSVLFANARDGVTTTSILSLKSKHRAIFLASHEETHGKLAIIRYVVASGKKGFYANDAATSSRLSPPAPFHGTGHYRAAPDGSTTWTGPLSVNFPGAPRFPLTGPSFETFLELPF
jgi:hypothetical protein